MLFILALYFCAVLFSLLQHISYCHELHRQLYIISGTFWLYACLATLGAIFLALFLPETKGKSLEEVEGLFAQPWCGGNTSQPVMPYDDKSVQYVHIRGLNRDGRESELDSPDDT